MAHLDVGSGDDAASLEVAKLVAGYLPDLLLPGAIAAGDLPFGEGAWETLALPPGVAEGRYFMYRLP